MADYHSTGAHNGISDTHRRARGALPGYSRRTHEQHMQFEREVEIEGEKAEISQERREIALDELGATVLALAEMVAQLRQERDHFQRLAEWRGEIARRAVARNQK